MACLPGLARAAEPDDFIVQQVCVDGADRAVMGDPAHCPKHRKLHLGEAVPYRRVDAGNWQALYSYPVRGPAGEIRAVAEKVFGGNDRSGSFGDLGVRSGFDLLHVGPDFVSGIRTSDPGGGDQIFWRNAWCERSDGWIFFPPGLPPGSHGETRSTLKITPGPSVDCPHLKLLFIAPDDTVWDHPVEPIRYTSGKLLDTITSEHFAYGDPENPAHDNDSMEKFYFTKEYGFSRWEAWQTLAGCRQRAERSGKDLAATCTPSPLTTCNGANSATFFGKVYLRLDCRDSTFYVTDTDRSFNPLVNDAAPGDIFNRNLLRGGTFADGMGPWRPEGQGLRAAVEREPPSNNSVLRMVCAGCATAGVTQDLVIPPGHGSSRLHWGVSLAAKDRAVDAKALSIKLVLTLNRAGGPPQRIEHVLPAIATWTNVGFDMAWNGSSGEDTPAKMELLLDGDADVLLDDAYVTVLDPQP
jgi:hypothetical protein